MEKKEIKKILKKYKNVFDDLEEYDKKKTVTIKLDEKDIDAIEDTFFCKLDGKERNKIKKRLLRIWRALCEEMEKK